MAVPCLGLGLWGIGRIIPSEEGIERTPDDLSHGKTILEAPFLQLLFLPRREVNIGAFFSHQFPLDIVTFIGV